MPKRSTHTYSSEDAPETDDAKIMQHQMGMGGAQPGQQPDMAKIFQTEAENLQLVEHTFMLSNAEERLVKAAADGDGAAQRRRPA